MCGLPQLKKREAIYSILESYALKNSYDLYADKCFIDLFAGSGSLGLEAISRGSAFGYFFEIDNEVLNTLTFNCKKKFVKKINFVFINKIALK